MKARDDGYDMVLADGRIVRIRPVTPTDAPALRALHRRACDESYYLRFFNQDRHISDEYVDRVCADTGDRHRLLVAETDQRPVALADCSHSPGSAEVDIAVLVDDEYQHVGVGSVLVGHLVAWARQAGKHRLVAEVLASNGPGLGVLRRAGFHTEPRQPGEIISMARDTGIQQKVAGSGVQ